MNDDRNVLLDAVDALTKDVRSKVMQEVDGHAVTSTVILPPLLTQLEEAVLGTVGIGGSSSLANERNMLNNDALHRAVTIRSLIADWARGLGVAVRPADKTLDLLRRWYTAWIGAPRELESERFYIRKLEGWAVDIGNMFDPPRIKDLPNACPLCGATEWTNETDGLRYGRPLIVTYKPDGADMIQQAKGMCRACLRVWSVRELAYAIEAVELAEAQMLARAELGIADDEPNGATGHDTRIQFERRVQELLNERKAA